MYCLFGCYVCVNKFLGTCNDAIMHYCFVTPPWNIIKINALYGFFKFINWKLPHELVTLMLKYFLLQPAGDGFHSQERVYKDLGEEMLQHSFDGKFPSNACDKPYQSVLLTTINHNHDHDIILLMFLSRVQRLHLRLRTNRGREELHYDGEGSRWWTSWYHSQVDLESKIVLNTSISLFSTCRLCKDLFLRINDDSDPDAQYSVEVSFHRQ